MKFRTSVLLAVVGLIAAILLATLVTLSVVLDRAATRAVHEDLLRGRGVVEDLYAYRQSLFQSQCRVMADEPRLKAVVDAQDVTAETVRGVALDLRKAARSDLFLILDGAGRIVADVLDDGATGEDLAQNPVIAAALRTGDGAGLWVREGRAYQVVARALSFGAVRVGVLVLGHELNDALAESVRRQTGNSVIIDLDGHAVAASALDGGQVLSRDALSAALAPLDRRDAQGSQGPQQRGDGGVERLQVGGVDYLGLSADLQQGPARHHLRVCILRSLDRAVEPRRRLTRVLLGIAAAMLCFGSLVSLWLSRRLSRPVDELSAFVGEIAAERLEARLLPSGPPELFALGEAMNRMVAEIARSRTALLEKERLHKEMEIAQRIQTSILPREVRVSGLDLSARMVPAEEVGGDYYDVLPFAGGAWIGVGDVAGHGLTAGLVMMMIQSSVATLAARGPDGSPAELLQVLNRILYENIRERLRQDEHVTFSLLRYTDDGRVIFAGAHEEIIVCHQDGRCEEVPTPGTWLGAMPEIGRFLKDSELRLLPGDLMILYTDGLTQARDQEGDLFGSERLCAAVRDRRDRPPAEICDHIMAAVAAFCPTPDDDITLLVLRYSGPSENLA